MTTFIHLVEGTCADSRRARVAHLSETGRRKPIVFAETGDHPCGPLDWLMGPGCACCLPGNHPRLHLIEAVAQREVHRIIIDAGPPAVADRIAAALVALPLPLRVNIVGA